MINTVELGQPAVTTESVVPPIVLTGQVSWDTPSPIAQIKQAFGDEPLSFLTLFVSPMADFPTIVAEARTLFPGTDIATCTTAGEISAAGYDEGKIIALGFPTSGFATTCLMVENIDNLDPLPFP
jgi:hypothetical protein